MFCRLVCRSTPLWRHIEEKGRGSVVRQLSTKTPFQIYEPVQEALRESKPVVALESTILSHGMPFPENVQLAESLASQLRERGVEPATIAMRNGVCKVGLSMDEIRDLSQARAEDRVVKCSTREIPLFLARQAQNTSDKAQWGATTVASTMRLAHMAGIDTFVTGGIGGVHRDGENSLDISADLTELGKTPVIVVSAGIKSILDIPRTLEVLETNSVPVVSYKTDEFPAFFSPHSGVASPASVQNADTIAMAYHAARRLGLDSGVLVAVPNQDPAGASVEAAIQTALQEANEKEITGQAVTPYILMRVAELTKGESLRSNVALVQQNAAVGADIAIAVAKRNRESKTAGSRPSVTESTTGERSQVVVMGGIVMDIVAKPEGELMLNTSNPATCMESDGGVGRNIAEVLGRLGAHPLLYSAVGNDSRGQAILSRLETECGVSSARDTVKIIDGGRTATYLAVLDGEGEMHVACADMDILKKIPMPPDDVLRASAMLVFDANPPLDKIREVVPRARMRGVEVFFEPTSVPKASTIARDSEIMRCLTHMSPNVDELLAMTNLESGKRRSEKEVALFRVEPGHSSIKELALMLLERMDPHEAHM